MTHLAHPAWTAGVSFWTQFWQKQLEQNLQIWAAMSQSLPHETARDFAAEAEASKKKA